MRTLLKKARAAGLSALWLLTPSVLTAQGTSPWVDAVAELERQFTGPIARGLSLIAIVVGGLMFAFGEGGSKRTLAGIIFGIGMAVGAVNFLAWLIPPLGTPGGTPVTLLELPQPTPTPFPPSSTPPLGLRNRVGGDPAGPWNARQPLVRRPGALPSTPEPH